MGPGKKPPQRQYSGEQEICRWDLVLVFVVGLVYLLLAWLAAGDIAGLRNCQWHGLALARWRYRI